MITDLRPTLMTGLSRHRVLNIENEDIEKLYTRVNLTMPIHKYDIVITPSGNKAVVTECSTSIQNEYLYMISIDFLEGKFGNDKNAWWNPAELKVIKPFDKEGL